MKYILVALVMANGLVAFSQSNSDHLLKLAAEAGIKRPVPQVFASRAVRVPIRTDSISMEQWHRDYVLRMQVGTGLLSGGVLLVISHILVSALVQHFNRNAVIVDAAVGVAVMTTGSILLPIATSERHRYRKTLRIELAKRGL